MIFLSYPAIVDELNSQEKPVNEYITLGSMLLVLGRNHKFDRRSDFVLDLDLSKLR